MRLTGSKVIGCCDGGGGIDLGFDDDVRGLNHFRMILSNCSDVGEGGSGPSIKTFVGSFAGAGTDPFGVAGAAHSGSSSPSDSVLHARKWNANSASSTSNSSKSAPCPLADAEAAMTATGHRAPKWGASQNPPWRFQPKLQLGKEVPR